MEKRQEQAKKFAAIWSKALAEYQRQTKQNLLDPTATQQVQSVDDLISMIDSEQAEFAEDSKSSKFSSAVKGAIGPFNFLTSTVGSTVAPMFPGGSQVLAAFSVLINAGRGVAGAFDAVGGLFQSIGAFTARMKEVGQEDIPDALIPIYQGMLVSLLKICAIATRITWRELKVPDDEKHERRKRDWLKRKLRPVAANTTLYLKELLMGGDAEISGAVGELKRLVADESHMMEAVMIRKTTKVEGETSQIKSITVDIKGMTLEMTEVVYEMQMTSAGISMTVEKVIGKLDFVTSQISSLKTAGKAAHEEQMSELSTIKKLLEARQEPATKAAQHKVAKQHDQMASLRSKLEIKKIERANAAAFSSANPLNDTASWILTEKPIQQWMEGAIDVAVVSGDSGFGKTYLASRIIKALQAKQKVDAQSSFQSSVAYFFCRTGHSESNSVNHVLRALAYQIAAVDKLFAKHLSDLFDANKISKADSGNFIVAQELRPDDSDEQPPPPDSAEPSADPALGSENQEQKPAVESELPDESAPASGELAEVQSAAADPDVASEEAATTAASDARPVVEDPFADRLDTLRRVERVLTEGAQFVDDDVQERVTAAADLWRVLFSDYFRKAVNSSACVVIDALDECGDFEAMALWTALRRVDENAATRATPNLRVLLAVKTELAAVFLDGLDEDSLPRTHVDAEKNRQDQMRFVRDRIASEWSDRLVRESLFEDATSKIVERSQGSFLRASLMVDEVTSLSRESIIRQKLDDLPETLEDATLLVVNRLARQLDQYEVQDLHDILAWVVCAHRSLSLAELDALLYMRDPQGARVVDLESRMRGTFASLFTLSGEDGLADKPPEERLRQRLPDDVAAEIISAIAKNSSAEKSGKNTGPKISDDIVADSIRKLKGVAVDLGHSLIKEQIQTRTAQLGLTTFTTDSMQAMVLIACLTAICEPPKDCPPSILDTACGYCSVYLPEHINDLNISEIDLATRTLIVRLLVKLLRDTECAKRWVDRAAQWMASDLLDTQVVQSKMIALLTDPEVQSFLGDDDRSWASTLSDAPVKNLFGGVARACAQRWLTTVAFHRTFTVLSQYLRMTGICKTERPDIEDENNHEEPDYSEITKEDIFAAAGWADLPNNALWYGRIGSTLRMENLSEDAISAYNTAIEQDSQNWTFQAGLAYLHSDQAMYTPALEPMKMAVQLAVDGIKTGKVSLDPDRTLAYCLLDYRNDLARYYKNLGDVEEAIQTLEAALEDWDTDETFDADYSEGQLEVALQYFGQLEQTHDCARTLRFVQRINKHPKRQQLGFLRLYRNILFSEPHLRRTAYQCDDIESIDQLLRDALIAVAINGQDGEVSFACYDRALFLLRLAPDRQAEALKFGTAALDEDDLLDGSSDWSWVRDLAEFELSRVYFTKALSARENDLWPEVGTYADQLVKLVHADRDAAGNINYGQRECAHVLAAWHRINNRAARARNCVKAAVKLALDMLSDTDPENDSQAWALLKNALLVIGDISRAITADNMLRRSRILPVEAETMEGDANPPETTAEIDQNGTEESEWQGDMEHVPGKEQSPETFDLPNGRPRPNEPASVNEANGQVVSDEKQDEPSTAYRVVEGEKSGGVAREEKAQDHEEETDGEQEEGEEVEAVEDLESSINQTNWYTCDGTCFSEVPNTSPLYRCSYCLTDFCESCYELIKRGEMRNYHLCGSTHDHVLIPGATAAVKGATTVRVGEDEVETEEWLAALRKDWDL